MINTSTAKMDESRSGMMSYPAGLIATSLWLRLQGLQAQSRGVIITLSSSAVNLEARFCERREWFTWHQTFVPDRFGTVQDVFIDGLGICIAGVVMLIRLRRRNVNVSSAPIEALAAARELEVATPQDFDRQK